MPVLIDLSLVAVALGSLLLLRLAGGAMPWGRLLIAVGPDGRPMRPRVRWRLWSMSHGESPRQAALAGFASVALGCAAVGVVAPRLVHSLLHPLRPGMAILLTFVLAVSLVLIPVGLTVLVRAGLDLSSRRCSMAGVVVGLRRDRGVFGRTYHVAIQAGDRGMARGLWAEAFKVDCRTFDRLSPGDRVSVEYSPHLRFVYRAVLPERSERGIAAAR